MISVKLDYAKNSPERAELTKAIQKLKSEFPVTIPIQINGAEVRLIPCQVATAMRLMKRGK